MVTFPAAFVPWKEFVAQQAVVAGFEVFVRLPLPHSHSIPISYAYCISRSLETSSMACHSPLRSTCPNSRWKSTKVTSRRWTSTAASRSATGLSSASTTRTLCSRLGSHLHSWSRMMSTRVLRRSQGSRCASRGRRTTRSAPQATGQLCLGRRNRNASCKHCLWNLFGYVY